MNKSFYFFGIIKMSDTNISNSNTKFKWRAETESLKTEPIQTRFYNWNYNLSVGQRQIVLEWDNENYKLNQWDVRNLINVDSLEIDLIELLNKIPKWGNFEIEED